MNLLAKMSPSAATMIRMDGGTPTVGDGLRIANARIGNILGYAVIAATVVVVTAAVIAVTIVVAIAPVMPVAITTVAGIARPRDRSVLRDQAPGGAPRAGARRLRSAAALPQRPKEKRRARSCSSPSHALFSTNDATS